MGLFKKMVGEAQVPGETTVTLPAGRVTISYDEERKGRDADEGSGTSFWPGVPAGLSVTVTPTAGGTPLVIEPTRGSVDYSTFRRIGSRYGRVEVPVAGEYTVSVAEIPPSARELHGPVLKLKA